MLVVSEETYDRVREISYQNDDTNSQHPDKMRRFTGLHEQVVNVWYDEGISAGKAGRDC